MGLELGATARQGETLQKLVREWGDECGVVDKGDWPGLKIYGKFRPIYPKHG